MKKNLLILFILLFNLLVFVACNSNVSHKHIFSDEWSYDENNHWHKCLDSECEETKDKQAHVFEDWITESDGTVTRKCSICKYKELEGTKGPTKR